MFGNTLSLFTGGPFLQAVGFQIPILAGFLLHTVAIVYVIFFLRESLKSPVSLSSEKLGFKRIATQPLELFTLFTRKRANRRELFILMGAFMLIAETNHAFEAGASLMVLSTPFCLPPNLLSYIKGIRSILHVSGLIISTKFLLRYVSGLALCLFSIIVTMMERMSMIVISTTSAIFIGINIMFLSV
jgi:hypothetical protein